MGQRARHGCARNSLNTGGRLAISFGTMRSAAMLEGITAYFSDPEQEIPSPGISRGGD